MSASLGDNIRPRSGILAQRTEMKTVRDYPRYAFGWVRGIRPPRALAMMSGTQPRLSVATRACWRSRRRSSGRGDCPPCSRQWSFGVAGDRHGVPFGVRAPHRGLRCMDNWLCMRFILQIRAIPRSRQRGFEEQQRMSGGSWETERSAIRRCGDVIPSSKQTIVK
jgi:hypothetical protein